MSQAIYEAVIGLEIHAQLMSQSKAFCTSAVQADALPNHCVGVVSAGMPGALPSLNDEVLRLAVVASLALNCHVAQKARFERKNYFYPDLPKGYQISQLASPISTRGFVDIYGEKSEKIRIHIDRIQIEEDAGKLTHSGSSTWIDLNRAGTALVEIVSKPDIRTPAQAAAYMRAVYNALVFSKVCDGNLEKGNFRCDANVSIRRVGDENLGTRTEIKNVNSFRFVEKAIDYEIARQISLVESGGKVVQETRGWDSGSATTYTMRVKEDAQDYRYFPDPDLPPIVLTEKWVEGIRRSMPPLPDKISEELQNEFSLEPSFARVLGSDPKIYEYFKKLISQKQVNLQTAARWICGDLLHALKFFQVEVSDLPFDSRQIVCLLNMLEAEKISAQNAKKLLFALFEEPKLDLNAYVHQKKWILISDPTQIHAWIDEVFVNHSKIVEEARSGNLKVVDFLQGQVMKISQGHANPILVSKILKEKL